MASPATLVDDGIDSPIAVSRLYAWVVFTMTFGLLLSDYMSRQVLNAVFPLLKVEWAVSDGQLGALSGIVALTVGCLTFPLSLLADRFGRVRSLCLMAVLWSLATLACALAKSYPQMLAARFVVGVGEAAYGSVGIAVVLSVFPIHLRATVTSAFMAGGMVGSVLGMSLGGMVAEALGWRWAFSNMALFGLVLAGLYLLVVRPSRIEGPRTARVRPSRERFRTLFGTPSVLATYVGSGLQLFITGSLVAWMPSYLNRVYDLAPGAAGVRSAVFVLVGAAGMVLCGVLSDRLSVLAPERKVTLALAYCVTSTLMLALAFRLPPGSAQIALMLGGMFVAAGTAGPAGAMVASLTHASVHGTAFATLTLANNFLGLAPGPYLTGALADRIGLLGALQWVPVMGLLAAGAFLYARGRFLTDVDRARHEASAAPDSESHLTGGATDR